MFGLIIGLFIAIVTAFTGFIPVAGPLMVFAGGLIAVIVPLVYGLIGFVIGGVIALLYNFIVKYVGGVEVELK